MNHLSLRSPLRTGTRSDDGAVLIFVALAMATLLIVAGLVVDGGAAYAQRRQMQNAADAAAMAGAAAIDDVRFNAAAPATVAARVQLIAERNGAESWDCAVIDSSANALGACSDVTAAGSPLAQGVRVTPADVRDTVLGAFAGIDTITARASAAATIQPIVGARAPFAVCSSGVAGKYDLLGPDNKVSAAKALARGKIAIMGAQVYKNDGPCNAGGHNGSFKGEIEPDLLVVGDTLVGSSNPGNSLPPYTTVACPAPSSSSSCLLLPITVQTAGTGSNASMTVTDWAYFDVTTDGVGAVDPPNGSVPLWGTFVAPAGPGTVPGGVPGSGPVNGGQARTVSLIE